MAKSKDGELIVEDQHSSCRAEFPYPSQEQESLQFFTYWPFKNCCLSQETRRQSRVAQRQLSSKVIS